MIYDYFYISARGVKDDALRRTLLGKNVMLAVSTICHANRLGQMHLAPSCDLIPVDVKPYPLDYAIWFKLKKPDAVSGSGRFYHFELSDIEFSTNHLTFERYSHAPHWKCDNAFNFNIDNECIYANVYTGNVGAVQRIALLENELNPLFYDMVNIPSVTLLLDDTDDDVYWGYLRDKVIKHQTLVVVDLDYEIPFNLPNDPKPFTDSPIFALVDLQHDSGGFKGDLAAWITNELYYWTAMHEETGTKVIIRVKTSDAFDYSDFKRWCQVGYSELIVERSAFDGMYEVKVDAHRFSLALDYELERIIANENTVWGIYTETQSIAL